MEQINTLPGTRTTTTMAGRMSGSIGQQGESKATTRFEASISLT